MGRPDTGRTAAAGRRPPGPDQLLVGAAAMVFVADLADPVLTGDDAHHLLQVLRLRPGEPVVAADGAGRWVLCRVAAGRVADRRGQGADPASILELDGPVVVTAGPRPALTVGFVPTKGDRPERVTRALTELGVDRIVPVRSARSVVRWDGGRGELALERLRRVAREAAAQSRRPWLPVVSPLVALEDLAACTGQPVRLTQPGGGTPSLDPPGLVVGPEGGWDAAELARHGPGVALGPTVLRSETAAVAAGAILAALRFGLVRPPL